jgi:predicted phosphodiesterase
MNHKHKLTLIATISLGFVLAFSIFLFLKFRWDEDSKIKIGIISDIHKCANYDEDLGYFTRKANSEKTNFNVSLGDNINFRVGPCSSSYKEDFKWIIENLKTNSSIYWVLGDHDIGDEKTYSYWKEITGYEKSYRSFDKGDYHIIILDTILGGEEMRLACENDETCSALQNEYLSQKELKKDEEKLAIYLEENKISLQEFKYDLNKKESKYLEEDEKISLTRSSGKRDLGRISEAEMNWVKEDLDKTEKNKVIIFSDHPIFDFSSERKSYSIVNGDKLRELLKKSGKEIVAISGEAHLWHEEVLDGIHYYIVGRYGEPSKNFAVFQWDKSGFKLDKYSQ